MEQYQKLQLAVAMAKRWNSLQGRIIEAKIEMHQRSISALQGPAGRLILCGRIYFLPTGCSALEARRRAMAWRPRHMSVSDWRIEVEDEIFRLRELHRDMNRDRAAIRKLEQQVQGH